MKFTARALALGSAFMGSLLLMSSAQAHHSTAQYDMSKRIRLVGTVDKFAYQNPHAWIWIDVPQSNGGTQQIGIECGSPSMLRHNGLEWDSLKKGDKVTIEAAPFKDTQRSGGILVSVTWADGHKWGGKGPFAAQGPVPAVAPDAAPAQ